MEAKVDVEKIRWQNRDGKQEVLLELAVEVSIDSEDITGLVPALRSEANDAITRLTGDLSNARKRAKNESVIQISLEEVPQAKREEVLAAT